MLLCLSLYLHVPGIEIDQACHSTNHASFGSTKIYTCTLRKELEGIPAISQILECDLLEGFFLLLVPFLPFYYRIELRKPHLMTTLQHFFHYGFSLQGPLASILNGIE